MKKTTKISMILLMLAGVMFVAGCGGSAVSTSVSTSSSYQTATDANILLNGQSVLINKAGNYTISGKLTNGQVVVDVGEKEIINLTLDGVDIKSQDSSPLLIKSGKATISLAEGSENILTDTTYTETQEENAALYAQEDLTIQGNGSLIINGNANDGLTSKDDLTIISGKITVNSKDDAIRGKNSLTIDGGELHITAGGDGLKSDDEEDGNLIINSGNITISAESDGAQAYHTIEINGGILTIEKSVEGLESEQITINDGEISITSSDDGINISDSSSSASAGMMHRDGTASGRSLIINGGNLKVNAAGDGLDSNGAILMNSGTVVVYGPENDGNAALDYDETFTINGGTLIAFGSAGMAQNVSEGSKQSAVLIGLSSAQVAGSTFSISDVKGNKIINLISDKGYNSVLVSTADLKFNTAYTYSANDVQLGSFTLTQMVSQTGAQQGMMRGEIGGDRGGAGGGSYAFGQHMSPLSEEEKLQMEQMRSLMDKQRAGATLTAEEKALLQQFEANRPQKGAEKTIATPTN